MTGDRKIPGPASQVAAGDRSVPDAAVREVVQLLGLAAEEERVLARLDRCIADLHRIGAARVVLAGCTDAELAEARSWIAESAPASSAPMLPTAGGEGMSS